MSGADDGAIWLIGCGNMAGAMLARWLATGLDPKRVTVIRPSEKPVAGGVRVLTAVPDEPPPQILLLGFKPHQLFGVATSLSSASVNARVVSILAGTDVATLQRCFPRPRSIVRVLPNLPVAIGEGVVAMHGEQDAMIETLMDPLGLVEWIADEGDFDAVTALAGSGPAFLYRFIDALAQAGAATGLSVDQAHRLALATVKGAALLAAASDISPADLAERVASKGGSTRKGLDVLDGDNALVTLLTDTLAATTARNAEMGAANRGG